MFLRLLNWLTGRSPETNPTVVPVSARSVDPDPDPPSGNAEPVVHSPSPRGPIQPDELRARLTHTLTQERARLGSGPDQAFLGALIRVLAERSLNLPPFPAAAREVQQILQEAQPRTLDLVLVVESDPGLLARVWSRASSVRYAEPPTRVDQAIARIGLDDLWRIAWKACVEGLSFDAPGFKEDSAQVLAHGGIVANVTARMGTERRGAPYLAGLLHDVGKLVVYRSANNDTRKALVERIAEEHHAEIGALLASIWGLDARVVEAIATHESTPESPLAKLLRIVDLAAEASGALPSLSREATEQAILAVDPDADLAILWHLVEAESELQAAGSAQQRQTKPTRTAPTLTIVH